MTEYEMDLVHFFQKNMPSGTLRSIRAVEVQYAGDGGLPPAPSRAQEEAPSRAQDAARSQQDAVAAVAVAGAADAGCCV